LLAGEYGESPPGSDFLMTGHGSLGRVLEQGGDLKVVVDVREAG